MEKMRDAEHRRTSKINARKTINNKMEKIRETAGGVIVNVKGDILLVRQKGSEVFWTFPKGGIEKGMEETAFNAAEREIWEESGIEKKDLEFVADLGNYQRLEMDRKNVTQKIFMFLFKTRKMELEIPPEFQNEIAEARWVKKDEVANVLSAPKDKEFFSKIAEKI
jgi:ADP-ribose pyrophosphatase YjhB (NUDIX family)